MLTSLVRKARTFAREITTRYRVLIALARLGHTPIMGGGDDPPKDPPVDPPKNTPPADPPKTFTQEDVDRIISDRLDRERSKHPSEDELKQLRESAARLQEIEDQNRTDLEKAAKRAEDAEAKVAELAQNLARTARRGAIAAAASELGVDADVVHGLLLDNNFEVAQGEQTFKVTVGDDGQVTGALDAVKAIAEAKNLVGQNTPPGPGDGGPRQPVTPKDLNDQIREAEQAGDVRTSMSLKTQKLAGLMADRK